MDNLLHLDNISIFDLFKIKDIEPLLNSFEKNYKIYFKLVDNKETLYYQSKLFKNGSDSLPIIVNNEEIGKLFFTKSPSFPNIKSFLDQLFKSLIKINLKLYVSNNIHLNMMKKSYQELQKKNFELKEALKSLKELDVIKSNFLATISHELKTPLTSIIGYAEFLELEDDLSEDALDNIERILYNANELFNLIKQLLDLSRIEAGAIRLHKEKVNVLDLVKELEESVSYQLQNKEISFEKYYMDQICHKKIYVDQNKIVQILRNLLTNAIKFSPKGSKIELKIENSLKIFESDDPDDDQYTFFGPEEKNYIKISIKDYGVGIPESQLEHIFEPFYQVDSSQTRNFGGTGLGLAIVKSFTEAHKGFYGVDSSLTKGSSFWIEIPIEDE